MEFHRSSFCNFGDCVEVDTTLDDLVGVRSSTDPDRALFFTADEWREFVRGVRAGEFDV